MAEPTADHPRPLGGRRRVRPRPALPPAAGAAVARVLPAEAAIDKEFDYLVPEAPAAGGGRTAVEVGTMVRVDLGGRRVGGWVVGTWEAGAGRGAGLGVGSAASSGGSETGVGAPEAGAGCGAAAGEGAGLGAGAAAGGAEVGEVERALRALALVSGWGPEAEVVELAGWAAWRWAGRRASLLATASPERRVPALPPPATRPPAAPAEDLVAAELRSALAAGEGRAAREAEPAPTEGAGPADGEPGAAGSERGAAGAPGSGASASGGPAGGERDAAPSAEPRAGDAGGDSGATGAAGRPWLLRLPPSADPTPVVAWLAQRGPTLVVVPALDRAAVLAGRLRRAGADVAVLPGDWAQARAGAAVVIGARAAAWGPCPGLAAVVVVDAHDPALVQEQAPTWSAVDVAAERARRAGVPCVVVSACPSVELVARATLVRVPPDVERAGWSVIDVIDRRPDDPRLGLYSRAVVDAVRSEGVVLCVLNRVGRARLLACAACGTVADCERCGAAVVSLHAEELSCPRCGLSRPFVCRSCTSTRLRQLRVGVSRAREELEALAGRPVGEVTAAGAVAGDAEVVVGTEALLHRRSRADAVVFLDFDQHLLGARLRAPEEALALLARASRLTGGRRPRRGRNPGRVLVQTRQPDHPVLVAAGVADPGRLAEGELAVREELRLPPATAVAAVSGPGAEELVAAASEGAGPAVPIEVLGPADGRWLLRAADPAALADALAALPRPAERVRIDVDPQRL